MKLKKKTKIITLLILLVIIGFFYYNNTKPGKYDGFAKCLTEKGAQFYGSFQCSHCATQKKLFGKSMKYVNYIECGPLGGPQNSLCTQKQVLSYPTWIINDKKYEGVKELNELSELTNCQL